VLVRVPPSRSPDRFTSSAIGGEPPRSPFHCVNTSHGSAVVTVAKSAGANSRNPYQRTEPAGSGH
jgi:hypothetical protein